jgi:LacI family transcriptional regulator
LWRGQRQRGLGRAGLAQLAADNAPPGARSERRRQAVTIKHVAADAGVSLQTVSRVINSDPKVSPQMKARVEASIEKLGYVPSIAAQRMSGSRSYIILALNDRDRTIADWMERQGVDWVDQMLLGGMLKCAELGYRMMIELVDTHSDHVQRELRATIAALQPDGVILTPPHSDNAQITTFLADHRIPFARIGSIRPGPGIRLTMDDERAARLATEHLVELGHRRIGFISGSDEYSLSQWRVDGWRAAMKVAGLGTSGLLACGDFTFASGEVAARHLLGLAESPTAIIASSDKMSLATLEVARDLGLKVPSDLSLISFDDTPIARFAVPPLTSVDQPIAATASRAVELIIDMQRGRELPDQPVVVPAALVRRYSTAGPPRRVS